MSTRDKGSAGTLAGERLADPQYPELRSPARAGNRPCHQQISEDELVVEHGALYPALQRLESRGWISAAGGISGNNCKCVLPTDKERAQAACEEAAKWKRLIVAVGRVLGAAAGEG